MKLTDLGKLALDRVKTVVENRNPAPPAETRDVFNGPAPERDWTVLVYMEGRHRLAHSTDLGLNKLEQVGSTDRAHVVVQATQVPHWKERILPNMRDLPTRRYYIQRDDKPAEVSSPVVQEMKHQLPLNSDNLADFLRWGMKNFPAKHTMVVIKKHGAGFASITRGEEAFAPLSASDLSSALSKAEQATGKKVDVVSWDSCSMQQLEVAYQLRNHAAVMTGSEEDVKAVAFPYGNTLVALNQLPQGSGAQQAGEAVVKTYSQRVANGMHSALNLSSLEKAAAKVKTFVDTVIEAKVPRDLLYTTMMDTAPMERTETMAMAFNFRDMGTFLEKVLDDRRFPDSVREAALEARQSLENSVIARYASDDRKGLRKPTGATGFFPWRKMTEKLSKTYHELDWAKDSGWARFLDYALEPQAASAPQTAAKPDLSLGQRFGRWGLSQYKKYISPNLNVSCAYTPSCSQFAREAIETHGLWNGGKAGALRFFSCTGKLHGHDPVRGRQERSHDHAHAASAKATISPPPVKDAETISRHQRWISMAKTAGAAAGALALGLVAAPVGLAVGAFVGFKTATGKYDEHVNEMAKTQNASIVQGYRNISEPLKGPVETVAGLFGKNVIAGAAGGAVGGVLGAMGAAFQGARWGSAFGGLWTSNRLKDALGELPADPATQAILRKDYHLG